MGEGKPELEQHANWKAPKPEDDRKQYPPGEIADLERSRTLSDNDIENRRNSHKKIGFSDEYSEELIQEQARQEMEVDLRRRERIKPKEVDGVLGEINRLWSDINQALNYRPERPKMESIIDKEWADAMLKSLIDLEEQIKIEGSFSTQIFDKEEFKTRERTKWLEPKWKNKIEALRMVLRQSGDVYSETPAEERQRRVKREKAIAEM